MNAGYPIMLRLEGKIVVVIGGGKVAERKAGTLLGTGASISVVSPEATAAIKGWSLEGRIVWKQKSFSAEDLQDAFMIFAATDVKEINQSIKAMAGQHQLVTVADNPEASDFYLPSHFQRGRMSIAVSTGGASPILAREIREQLERQFGEKYEDYLDFLYSKRQWILKWVKDSSLKRKLLTAIASEEFLTSSEREADFQRLLERR